MEWKCNPIDKIVHENRCTIPLLLREGPRHLCSEGDFAMRLTLRTLLAYLDDTLEPTQAKAIGHKIAESPTAQEIIDRIREVVRRRRLTTPPLTGPGAKLDPSMVAQYIDSTLSAAGAAEVAANRPENDGYPAQTAAV